jgi:endonuclease-3 related protein
MRSSSDKTVRAAYDRLYEAYGPQDWWPGDTRFEIIVGAILTQNTAWTNVEKAIANLKRERILTPEAMKKAGKKTLASLIRPAGYYNIKTERLKNFIAMLFSGYGGSLASMAKTPTVTLRRELLSVNGIGPETCDSIMLYAFNRPVFVVDAYTKRIFSRHGLFKETADYHYVQKFFSDRVGPDAKVYNEYHALIVRLAKKHCRKKPDCVDCPLGRLELS